jgi:hypothetical protein
MAEAIFNDVFGRLTWDDREGCWLGGMDWPPGRYTEVAIWHPGDDLAAGLRMAQEGWDWLQSHEGHARRCIAGELLWAYNHAWRKEDEPLTEAAFLHRLELVYVGFGEDGSLLLSYDGRGLFGGQGVEVEFGPDRSFRGARLVD